MLANCSKIDERPPEFRVGQGGHAAHKSALFVTTYRARFEGAFLRYAWDARGRLSAVSRDAAVVQSSSYDGAGVRIVKREGASTTLYLAPDFEVRDGIAGSSTRAMLAEPAFTSVVACATLFFPDIAPLLAANRAEAGVGAIRS